MKMALIGFGVSIAMVGVYMALTWSNDGDFQWLPIVGVPVFGALSGLIVGRAKWNLSESSFRRTQSARH